MKTLHLKKTSVNLDDYRLREALVSDVSQVIKGDVMIYVDDQPTLMYKVLEEDLDDLRWAVKRLKYHGGPKRARTRGLSTNSTTFGFAPRLAFRQDYCRASGLSNESPKEHFVISSYASKVSKYYEDFFPVKYREHKDLVSEKVKEEWVIKDSPFTSGIVNKNSQLKYHIDGGNFKGMLSNMVVFKKDVEGGYLVIPELDIALEVADKSLTIFNGQILVHGVSPIEYKNSEAYRFSIVYYSLEQMWKCETLGDEIKRVRQKKDEREKNRLDPEHLQKLMDGVRNRTKRKGKNEQD